MHALALILLAWLGFSTLAGFIAAPWLKRRLRGGA